MASQEVTEETLFLKLFDQILEKRSRTSDDEIRESIRDFVDYFRINRSAAGACSADRFESPADYLGYFYWHSTLSAAVTRDKALDAIQNCKNFRSCFNHSSLKVVSVGGGPGSDLVGLYSAIYKNSVFQEMFVCIVDNISKWKLYSEVVRETLTDGDFGDASQLIKNRECFTSYICADMRKTMTPDCQEALKEASLVWMKGFLSTLDDDFERHRITEKIILSMTRGALLVVMESRAYDQFDDFVERELLRRLYNTDGGYTLALKLNSMPKFRIAEDSRQEIIIFERI